MNKLTFYDKTSILIFSILLTGFGGAVMLGYNLRKAGKHAIVIPLAILTLVGNAIIRQVILGAFPDDIYSFIISNVVCGVILIFPVWDHYLSEFTSFISQKVWLPLAVTAILYGSILLLVFLR